MVRALEELQLPAERLLEIGAGDGWRLGALRERGLGKHFSGLDPSRRAATDGRRRFGVDLLQATAECLPFASRSFDVVVLGFCLYLCDRDDLFQIAAETDRVLAERGSVVVFDFYAGSPRRTPYAHAPGQYSYKMDYSGLFAWNPSYQTIHREILPYPGGAGNEDLLMVAVLQRDAARAYAEDERA